MTSPLFAVFNLWLFVTVDALRCSCHSMSGSGTFTKNERSKFVTIFTEYHLELTGGQNSDLYKLEQTSCINDETECNIFGNLAGLTPACVSGHIATDDVILLRTCGHVNHQLLNSCTQQSTASLFSVCGCDRSDFCNGDRSNSTSVTPVIPIIPTTPTVASANLVVPDNTEGGITQSQSKGNNDNALNGKQYSQMLILTVLITTMLVS